MKFSRPSHSGHLLQIALQTEEFRKTHQQNVASVAIWCLLYLLCPEVAFRVDAVGAIYALAEHLESLGEGGKAEVAASKAPRLR